MRFELRVSHIHTDYTITSEQIHDWTVTVEDEEEFCLLLNRIAIATTQHSVVDFPEVEISWENKKALVRAIDGQLYYTEFSSVNRKDLKVIPEEVWRLLEGQSMEQAFARRPEEAYVPMGQARRRRSKRFRTVLGVLSFAVFGICASYSWHSLTFEPSLVRSASFVHIMESEGEILREYADVYYSEMREGAMILELRSDGIFAIYELWFSPERNKFVLVPIETHRAMGGLSGDERALMAGERHLLRLGEDLITLHGVEYFRYGKKLSTLGEVLDIQMR